MENEIYRSKREIDMAMFGKVYFSTPCIVCGEYVALNEMEEAALSYGRHVSSKICDKCKAAILYMREQMP